MNDQDLQAAFDALRRETGAGLAPFRMPRQAAPRRAFRWHVRPILATGLLAAAAVILVLQHRALERRAMLAPFLSSTTWEAPTDFLLATPGQELLSATSAASSVFGDTAGGTP